jgi:hypothetical protein
MRQVIDELTRNIARLEERLDRTERAAGTPQLPNSSLTGGGIKAVDAAGTHRGTIGFQNDGTFAVTYLNGDAPPTPTDPVVAAHQLALVIYWDGKLANGTALPADFQRVDVHMSETAGFTPDGTTVVGSLLAEGAISVVGDNDPKYVKLVAVTHADVASTPTGEVSATPLPADQIAAGAIDGTTITGATILTDSDTGGFFAYSGTPTAGNLIVSATSAAGTDAYGNSYPQGLNVTQGEIDGTAINAATLTAGSLSSGNIGSSIIVDSEFQGGRIENATISFDSNGGALLVYASTTTTQTFTTSGSWTAPPGCTSVTVECWGAGGGGWSGNNGSVVFGSGGVGGVGGSYAKVNALAVTPGNSYPYVVGAGGSGGLATGDFSRLGTAGGDSSFNGTSCLAKGGPNNNPPLPGSTGDVTFIGGNGGYVAGDPPATGGAGGAGSAGPNSSGRNAANATGAGAGPGATAVSGGGAGGAGGAAGTHNGVTGGTPGGGGGGGGGSTSATGGYGAGGAGARGQVKVTYLSGTTLIASISGMAGTDQYGNSYPAGISGANPRFTGVLSTNTWARGQVTLSGSTTVPRSVVVTGLGLPTGLSYAAQVTAETTAPDNQRTVSFSNMTASQMTVWCFRVTSADTIAHYWAYGY